MATSNNSPALGDRTRTVDRPRSLGKLSLFIQNVQYAFDEFLVFFACRGELNPEDELDAMERGVIRSHRTNDWTPGWPRLAARKNHFQNSIYHRRFGKALQQNIIYFESCIVELEKKLDKLAREMEASGDSKLRGPAAPMLIGDDDSLSTGLADEWQRLHLTLFQYLKKYAELVQIDRNFRALPQISMEEYLDNLGRERREGDLNQEAMLMMQAPDDFFSERHDRLYHKFNFLIYGKPHSILSRFFIKAESREGIDWNTERMEKFFFVVLVLYAMLLVLVPVGILFLVPLGKATSFGVVVIFVCLYGVSPAYRMRQSVNQALFGLCAYMAVLVAVLVLSSYGGGPGS